MSPRRLLHLALALLLASTSGLALAAAPQAFTATYRVLRDGSPMGEATVSLQPLGNGRWEYSKHMRGTSGLAALLGARLDEVSQFRWKGDVPEALSYDYRLEASVKTRQRHVRVDWDKHRVSVDEGKGAITYAAVPGMVERNTTALAIGLALRGGQTRIALPVAVKQEVETQRFEITGKEKVRVPAGRFDAVRVDRSDADRGFSAWYAPQRYPLPVKLSQKEGGDLTMELVRFSPR